MIPRTIKIQAAIGSATVSAYFEMRSPIKAMIEPKIHVATECPSPRYGSNKDGFCQTPFLPSSYQYKWHPVIWHYGMGQGNKKVAPIRPIVVVFCIDSYKLYVREKFIFSWFVIMIVLIRIAFLNILHIW